MSFLDKMEFKGFFFSLFLVFSLLLVGIQKYALSYYSIHLKYTWVSDFIFFILIGLTFILKKNYKLILIVFILFLVKAIGSVIIIRFYDSQLEYFREVFKTTFTFTFIFYLYYYLRSCKKIDIEFIFKTFKYVSLCVNFTIVLGTVFSISFFKTYLEYLGERFGFSGILYPQSFSSYFIIISILIYYFYNKNIEDISPFFIIYTYACSLFIGTKAVYFFLPIFLLVVFFENKAYKKIQIIIPIILVFVLSLFNYNLIKAFFIKKFDTLYGLFLEEDIQTFLLSYRNLKFNNAKEYVYDNWSFVNYFIGGVNRKKLLVEMELVDVFFSLGILGTTFFIYYYYKLMIKPICFEKINVILFVALFIVIILSGNFLKSLTLSYFVAFLFSITINKSNKFS